MFIVIVGVVGFLVLGTIFSVVQSYRRQATDFGYGSLIDYLRAVPSTDNEKRHAVDMAMQGFVLCVLGLALPPLLLIGVFPLYFGGRKISYSMMGLGLIDDAG